MYLVPSPTSWSGENQLSSGGILMEALGINLGI
jgi:hypothetical protein